MTDYATETGGLIRELLDMTGPDPQTGAERFGAFLMADKPRARAIGERLHEIGGPALVAQVRTVVERSAPRYCLDNLGATWAGLGAED